MEKEININNGIDEKQLLTRASLIASLNLSIDHSACSLLNPVRKSRSKSTTCARKESLLRFQLNSTATTDGSVQKFGNNLSHDSVSIATNVCSSQISSK